MNGQGERELAAKAERTGDTIQVSAEGAGKPWKLVLRGIKQLAGVQGGSAQVSAQGVIITPEAGHEVIISL
ncbi:Alpha-xylosidase [compost metagenome]